MNHLLKITVSLFALAFFASVTVGCDDDSSLENAAEDAEQSMEETGDNIDEGVEDFGNDMEDGANDVQNEAEDLVE